MASTLVVAGILGGALITVPAAGAVTVTWDKALTISAKDGNGSVWTYKVGSMNIGSKIGYCIEAGVGSGSNSELQASRSGKRATTLSSYKQSNNGLPLADAAVSSAKVMRKLNWVLDTYDHPSSNKQGAAAQIAVWLIRGFNGNGAKWLRTWVKNYDSSLLDAADAIVAKADKLYDDGDMSPKDPVPITSTNLPITLAADKKTGRVTYPAGSANTVVTSITLTGAKFQVNKSAVLKNDYGKAGGSKPFEVTADTRSPAGFTIAATGTWVAEGVKGWEPELTVYAPVGGGQEKTVATGSHTPASKSGSLSGLFVETPIFELGSQAQAAAQSGTAAVDRILVSGVDANIPSPGQVDALAYLRPIEGATRHAPNSWNPMPNPAYDPAVVDPTDPAYGQHLRWTEADVCEYAGESDPACAGTGEPGIAQSDVIDDTAKAQKFQVGTTARTNVRATNKAGAYNVQIAVPADPGGLYLQFVERYWVLGEAAPRKIGSWGAKNEQTKLDQPGFGTQATPQAMIGGEAGDRYILSGVFNNTAYDYRLGEAVAYKKAWDADGDPQCLVANEVFRAPAIELTNPQAGDEFDTATFTVKWAHLKDNLEKAGFFWIGRLEYSPKGANDWRVQGEPGECGDETETTDVPIPGLSTQADATGPFLGLMYDTANVTEGANANAHAQWEVVHPVYEEKYTEQPNPNAGQPGEEPTIQVPVCEVGNLYNGGYGASPAMPVNGAGSYKNAGVRVVAGYSGKVWWAVELTLIEDGVRHLVAKDECGLDNETTLLDVPSFRTEAVDTAMMLDEFWDRFYVDGNLDESDGSTWEADFQVFGAKYAADGITPVCDTSNLRIDVPAVQIRSNSYSDSRKYAMIPEYAGENWWVGTAWKVLPNGDRIQAWHDDCGTAGETTVGHEANIRTEAQKKVVAGVDKIWDSFIIDDWSGYSDDPAIEYFVTLRAFTRDDEGKMTCRAEDEITELRDDKGTIVTGAGRYESPHVLAPTKYADVLGGYQETLNARKDGRAIVLKIGNCAEASEAFEILAPNAERPELPRTGFDGLSGGLLGGLGFLGAGILLTAVARWRRMSR